MTTPKYRNILKTPNNHGKASSHKKGVSKWMQIGRKSSARRSLDQKREAVTTTFEIDGSDEI